jgi:hypothetical protein
VEIVFEIGAIVPAARFAVGTAVVATSPAVRVGPQIGAGSITNRSWAADVISAGADQTARVAVARLASSKALILLRFVGTATAKCLARILLGTPGRVQPQWAEDGPRQSGSEQAQRLAAWNGLVERLGEFIE